MEQTASLHDGLELASAAVRMRLKNRIIVRALREHSDWDPRALLPEARTAYGELSAERHLHRDPATDAVAAALAAIAADEDALLAVIESAREAAWDELGREIERRLESQLDGAAAGDPSADTRELAERREALRGDLRELERTAASAALLREWGSDLADGGW